jgi:hypothetical protein
VEPNRFVATFPARVLDHVRPGQPATVELDGVAVPAKVAAIGMDAATSQVQVILLAATERAAPASAKSAEASVEVESVSPATLVLRAIGRGNR